MVFKLSISVDLYKVYSCRGKSPAAFFLYDVVETQSGSAVAGVFDAVKTDRRLRKVQILFYKRLMEVIIIN